jgi:hypothetical protein
MLNAPSGLAVDGNGTVYISDTGNCRIRRVLPASGFISTIAGATSCGTFGDGGPALQAQLVNNGEISLDRTGSELIIASNGPTIRTLNLATGIIDRFAGSGVQGPAQNNIPSLQANLQLVPSVHVDAAAGSVLFVDIGANRVGKVVNGTVSTVAGTSMFAGDGAPAQYAFLSQPVDVLTEPGGNLLISESINRRIRWGTCDQRLDRPRSDGSR